MYLLKTSHVRRLFVSLFALSSCSFVQAQDADDDVPDTLAKAAQNPIASLISLPFQNNTDFGISWNLITRTIVPVVSQPGLSPGQDRVTGIGDTTFTAFFSPRNSGKWTWGVGPVIVLPTGSNDRLTADKWGAGISFVALTMPGNWVIGSLISNVKSVGGGSGTDFNIFTWQYFVNYNFNKGWYLTSAPIITANWEADGSDRWTVPFGGGFGRVMKIGKQPVNMSMQAYKNVETPTFGAEWQLRLQVQLLFPK
jgi:hypothetical protein